MISVLIRPLIVKDAETSWKWRNDEKVWKYTGKKPDRPITLEIELGWIQKVVNDSSSKRFAILVDKKYVGNIQLTNITTVDAQYHIFIGDKEYWGKGVARLATYQILYFAKNVLQLKKINLQVNEEHTAAIKLYKKCGFHKANLEDGFIKMNYELSTLPSSKVSIFMMVYNHEKFLKEALESILMQKTRFAFDIVVGEDCSTDNSRKILLEYASLYPGKFKILLHKINIGAHANQEKVFNECMGEYLAFCEGDDYWLNEEKLSKQVNFMDNNLEYNLCFHPVEIVNYANKIKERSAIDIPKELTFQNLINKNFIHTSSVLTRRNALPLYLPKWFHQISVGDWPLHLIAASTGKIKMLNETLSTYRVHTGGTWSQRHQMELDYLGAKRSLELKKYFDKKYTSEFNRAAANRSAGLLFSNLNSGKKYRFFEAFLLYYRTALYRPLKNIFSPIKILFNKNSNR